MHTLQPHRQAVQQTLCPLTTLMFTAAFGSGLEGKAEGDSQRQQEDPFCHLLP